MKKAQENKLARERVEALPKDAASFRQAADIRTFVEAVLTEVRRTSTRTSLDLRAWAQWARDQADLLDLLASGTLLRDFEDK